MPAAGSEQRPLVGEVAVDGQALHPRPLGDGAYGRARHTHGPVQLDRCLDDPPARAFLSGVVAATGVLLAGHAASSTYFGVFLNIAVLFPLTTIVDQRYRTFE
jgi:hypothetical protein